MMMEMTMMILTTCAERRFSMRAISKARSCAEVGAASSHLRVIQFKLTKAFKSLD